VVGVVVGGWVGGGGGGVGGGSVLVVGCASCEGMLALVIGCEGCAEMGSVSDLFFLLASVYGYTLASSVVFQIFQMCLGVPIINTRALIDDDCVIM